MQGHSLLLHGGGPWRAGGSFRGLPAQPLPQQEAHALCTFGRMHGAPVGRAPV